LIPISYWFMWSGPILL